jgi:hypothetical protein
VLTRRGERQPSGQRQMSRESVSSFLSLVVYDD